MTRAEDVINRVVEFANKHDLDSSVALFDPDVICWNPISQEIKGREARRKVIEIALKAIPDLQWQIKTVLVQGDSAVFEALESGTFTGLLELPNGNIQPTKKSYRLPFIAFLRINNVGLIVEYRNYWDNLSFIRQLGIELRA